tara:strand:+ start:171 stop:413 length:243 start_codon:yes stop_codon:yes gene_type:complete
MIWLNWIISPVGRWLSAALGALAFLGTIYLKGRSAGKDVVERRNEDDINKRSKKSLEAEQRVRDSIARGGLYTDDGHKRD